MDCESGFPMFELSIGGTMPAKTVGGRGVDTSRVGR
jgi:hypothetical protein